MRVIRECSIRTSWMNFMRTRENILSRVIRLIRTAGLRISKSLKAPTKTI